MTQAFLDGRVVLHAGDCLAVLDTLAENSVDAVVTDPPYHYDTIVKRFGKAGSAEAQFGSDGAFKRAAAGFMGKQWDGGDVAFDPNTWAKVLRVLKPGGMIAAFSAPKCYHKMAYAIELAGFEMRDRVVHLYDLSERETAFLASLSPAQQDALVRIWEAGDPLGDLFWTFGSGFPKSLDVSKAIDKAAGVKRDVLQSGVPVKRMIPGADQGKTGWTKDNGREFTPQVTAPATDAAIQWQGWGTALKPAYEPIALARKPLAESSVAAQVQATGTGAVNIDACRVGTDDTRNQKRGGKNDFAHEDDGWKPKAVLVGSECGRWPANITHDGSDEVVNAFPDAPGALREVNDSFAAKTGTDVYGDFGPRPTMTPRGDAGTAARFFYTAKADGDDRLGSGHPTVKPVALMRWLCRLLTPPGGLILDPFSGTGTTGEAAFLEGFSALLIEREEEYRKDIARRMAMVLAGPDARKREGIKVKAERRGDPGEALALFEAMGITAASASSSDGGGAGEVRAGKFTASSPMKAGGDRKNASLQHPRRRTPMNEGHGGKAAEEALKAKAGAPTAPRSMKAVS